ncbi:MAG: hypothetical protein SFU86_01885 [Pirellulaceae bacterium]|nr:hypothetical protein [Pirellulaceae bacterium]
MPQLYFILTAVHLVAIVITGVLWFIVDIDKTSSLRKSLKDIRAVHFGSLYLVPMFLSLLWAFERLHVPAWHQGFFPAGLGLLVLFSSIGYLFPRPADLDEFYYWTRGWPLILASIGLVCLTVGMLWTAAVLVWYAVVPAI